MNQKKWLLSALSFILVAVLLAGCGGNNDKDLGRHDIELQLMVSAIRGSGRIPRFVLGQVEFGRWIVLQVAETRGGEPTRISDDVFDDLRAAERFVFALRLQLLAAEDAK